MLTLRRLGAPAAMVGALACGDGTGPAPLPTSVCTDASVRNLNVGAHVVIDAAAEGSCVRVPAAGAGGAEYLFVALAGEGTETSTGVKTPYHFDGGASEAALGAAPALPNPTLSAFRSPMSAGAFHRQLRQQERALVQAPGAAFRLGPQLAAAAVVPPVNGHQRTFLVCANQSCRPDELVPTTATAKHVGSRVAIYVDNDAPTDGYSQADLDRVGNLFDDYLYPIDTVAFGRESDIDNNGVVVVLLTQHVNALSDDCSESVILGYFFGLDLLPSEEGSNGGEIFYGLVPDPANLDCQIKTDYANRNVPPTFIHEFQHMINFNQRVLVRKSFFSEDGWLNEGLSHFAEELAGWKIPDSQCVDNDCLSQFAASNLVNAYNYLTDPEAVYLVAPGNSSGSLEERGAGWLFVRWLADHFGTDEFGTNVTRALVGTSRLGAANVEFVTKQPFPRLAATWQLANYLDDLPAFTPMSSLLAYPSWSLRTVFGSFHGERPSDFPTPYPLVPDQVTGAGYTRAGTLRAGSGRHLRVVQPANGGAIDLRLTGSDGESLPTAAVKPRIALARIR